MYDCRTNAFKRQTVRVVNELKRSAEDAETKLENIEEQAEHLMQTSSQIHDSLLSIDIHTQQVAQASKIIEDHIRDVLKHFEEIYAQSKERAASQSELKEAQAIMKVKPEEGIEFLHDSYSNLGVEIDNLKNETIEIEKEIEKVGDEMSLKMRTLQGKADDIGIWEYSGNFFRKAKSTS